MNDETRQTIDRLSDLATGRTAGDFKEAYREAVRSADVVMALRDTGQLPSYNAEAVYTSMREKGLAVEASARQSQDQTTTAQQTALPPASASVQDHLKHAMAAVRLAADASQGNTTLVEHAQRSVAAALQNPGVVEALQSAGVKSETVMPRAGADSFELQDVGFRLQRGAVDQAHYDKKAEVLGGLRERGELSDASAHRDVALTGTELRRHEQDIRVLVTDMSQQVGQGTTRDTPLAVVVRNLEVESKQSWVVDNADFRDRVATTLRDVERATGPLASVPAALREEMSQRAASAPEGQNDNMATSIQRVVEALKSSASIGTGEERPATPLAARLQSWRDAETAQAPTPAPAQSPAPSPVLETVGPSQSRSSSPSPG